MTTGVVSTTWDRGNRSSKFKLICTFSNGRGTIQVQEFDVPNPQALCVDADVNIQLLIVDQGVRRKENITRRVLNANGSGRAATATGTFNYTGTILHFYTSATVYACYPGSGRRTHSNAIMYIAKAFGEGVDYEGSVERKDIYTNPADLDNLENENPFGENTGFTLTNEPQAQGAGESHAPTGIISIQILSNTSVRVMFKPPRDVDTVKADNLSWLDLVDNPDDALSTEYTNIKGSQTGVIDIDMSDKEKDQVLIQRVLEYKNGITRKGKWWTIDFARNTVTVGISGLESLETVEYGSASEIGVLTIHLGKRPCDIGDGCR